MPTENTSLKNVTPAGDSNTTHEMVIGKSNTYQRPLLIVAGSLLALLVLIAVAGTSVDQHLQSSTHEITKGAEALSDYQADSANLALTKDIFGESNRGKKWNRMKKLIRSSCISYHWYLLSYNLYLLPSFIYISSRVSVFK